MGVVSDNNFQGANLTSKEVCAKCGLPEYVLRYWELNFPQLEEAGRSGQYSEADVAVVWRIKRMIYVDFLSLPEAQKKLEEQKLFPMQDPNVNSPMFPGIPRSAAPQRSQETERPVQQADAPQGVTEPAAETAQPLPEVQDSARPPEAEEENPKDNAESEKTSDDFEAARQLALQKQHKARRRSAICEAMRDLEDLKKLLG